MHASRIAGRRWGPPSLEVMAARADERRARRRTLALYRSTADANPIVHALAVAAPAKGLPRGCRGAAAGLPRGCRGLALAGAGARRQRRGRAGLGPLGSGRGLPGPQRQRLVRVLQEQRRDEEVRVDDHLKQTAARFKRPFVLTAGRYPQRLNVIRPRWSACTLVTHTRTRTHTHTYSHTHIRTHARTCSGSRTASMAATLTMADEMATYVPSSLRQRAVL